MFVTCIQALSHMFKCKKHVKETENGALHPTHFSHSFFWLGSTALSLRTAGFSSWSGACLSCLWVCSCQPVISSLLYLMPHWSEFHNMKKHAKKRWLFSKFFFYKARTNKPVSVLIPSALICCLSKCNVCKNLSEFVWRFQRRDQLKNRLAV